MQIYSDVTLHSCILDSFRRRIWEKHLFYRISAPIEAMSPTICCRPLKRSWSPNSQVLHFCFGEDFQPPIINLDISFRSPYNTISYAFRRGPRNAGWAGCRHSEVTYLQETVPYPATRLLSQDWHLWYVLLRNRALPVQLRVPGSRWLPLHRNRQRLWPPAMHWLLGWRVRTCELLNVSDVFATRQG